MTDRPGIIYLAVNRVNGKAYVGQTKTSFRRRIGEHVRGGDRQVFDQAVRKHGRDSFDFAVLESCLSQSSLHEAEKKWIKHFACKAPNGYNICEGGKGTPGTTISESHKERLRQAHLGKPSWNAGMKMGPEWLNPQWRKNLAAGQRRRFAEKGHHMTGKHIPDAVKAKMSKTHKDRGTNVGSKNGMFGKTREQHPQFGKHHTESANTKNREAHLALCADPEYRKKLGDAHRGKPWSAARRAAHEAKKQ